MLLSFYHVNNVTTLDEESGRVNFPTFRCNVEEIIPPTCYDVHLEFHFSSHFEAIFSLSRKVLGSTEKGFRYFFNRRK